METKKKILFIDDEKATILEITNCFSGKYSLRCETSLQAAEIFIMKKEDIFCAIIDLKLDNESEFSGVKLIKRLKEEMPHVPYFVFSAYSPSDHAKEAFQEILGVDEAELKRITEEQYIPKNDGNYLKMLNNKLSELEKRKRYDFGEYFCLLIAIDHYDFFSKLQKPRKDAEVFREVLEKRYTFRTEMVDVPTRKNIIDALRGLRSKVSERTNLVIFFAGHGIWDEEQDKGYWLPCDAEKESYANWISNDEVKNHLRPLQAKHILLILDSCFAGSISRKSECGKKRCEEDHKTPSRKALTSCARQPTPDESLFFKEVVRILSENDQPFATLSLFDALRNSVVEGADRHPQLIDLYGHQEGDFIFVPVCK